MFAICGHHHARHPLRFMNILVEDCQFFKTSSKSEKLIFEDGEIVVFRFEVWIGENMCTSCERISGIYGIKTRTLFRASRISDLYGIPCRGVFIELGLDIRWICEVARLIQAIYGRI